MEEPTPDPEQTVVAFQPKVALKASEKKWGLDVLRLGWCLLPSLLFRAQRKLNIKPLQMAVLLQLLEHWWEADRAPYPNKETIAHRLDMSPRPTDHPLPPNTGAPLEQPRGGTRPLHREWLQRMGIPHGGKSYAEVRDQAARLCTCKLTLYYAAATGRTGFSNERIVDDGLIKLDDDAVGDARQGSLFIEKVRLNGPRIRRRVRHPGRGPCRHRAMATALQPGAAALGG